MSWAALYTIVITNFKLLDLTYGISMYEFNLSINL